MLHCSFSSEYARSSSDLRLGEIEGNLLDSRCGPVLYFREPKLDIGAELSVSGVLLTPFNPYYLTALDVDRISGFHATAHDDHTTSNGLAQGSHCDGRSRSCLSMGSDQTPLRELS